MRVFPKRVVTKALYPLKRAESHSVRYTEAEVPMFAVRRITMMLIPAVLGAADFQGIRKRMVREQLESRGIHNPAVLEAIGKTPRHLFVPKSLKLDAYGDHPLSIGHGQTISQPYIVALMTELLDVRKPHTVLEIGTGSGYQAAVLSMLAKDVYTIEIVPELARESAALLKQLGYTNVLPRQGDGYQGWPEHAPFDRIIFTAAPPEIPKALTGQLAVGGKLVAPEGAAKQKIVVIEKLADGTLRRRENIGVRFVPMVG